MSTRSGGGIRPGDVEADVAERASRRIRDYLTSHPDLDTDSVQGELAGDDALILPRSVTVMVAQILSLLANGQGVQVIPDMAELTTQQAADYLNVSRPFLIKVLEQGDIPFHRIGTHRRIRFQDLREYKLKDDQKQRQAADELTRLTRELGLY